MKLLILKMLQLVRRYRTAVFGAVCVLSASFAFSQDITFSGSAKTAVGVFIRGDNAGDFSPAKETVSGEIDARFADCTVFIAGNAYFNALAANSGGSFSVTDGLGAELQEAYFTWTSNEFGNGLTAGLKFGRQITAWGKADGIRIADILCPQNLASLGTSNYSESRLGIDAIKGTLSGTYFTADAYWIPFFRPSALPFESWNPLRKALIPSSVGAVPVVLGDISKPELNIANSSYAARVSFWFPAIDFSLYGYYGFDDSPNLSYVPDMPPKITVTGKYYRYGMAGFDLAVPAGAFVIRAESAFFIERALQLGQTSLGGYKRKNELRALAGFDWNKNGWMLTAQYYGDVVFAYVDSLARDAYEHGATANLSKTLFSETLTLSCTGLVRLNDLDGFAGLKAKYNLTDEISLALAFDGYFPGPKSDGTYGKYKDLSCVRFEGTVRF
ncbi:hypothetical protein HMPREF0860_0825 [Treponema socranskii subsp. socranskii VPI DR56BR1116 = ATCC 35536]|uniref:Uncharacterized protein n=1 Tax=Treponema socranskii subsp. socranskii VPI DR56BR1116 = ATCC 35536 TaxID=1125725 RepID=U2MSE4_TRESO|nr:DUF1302 family protein [Treponema socranskii]ERF61335.1 hypothetical protein HMPREF1325_2129 [Treponema socranskii subsp. socranskii VPI DR56BR1116 = ATCC 35536]ERK04555.1 hypothetical protein HMPREF0860_0825 [Treponema socranskii subsp. socranskii VPI DR56BR1116 = ATCC 35536]